MLEGAVIGRRESRLRPAAGMEEVRPANDKGVGNLALPHSVKAEGVIF